MNENQFEKFEQYLQGDISPEDRALLESELAKDAELAEMFRIYKTIDAEMLTNENDNDNRASLKETLNRLSAVYFNKSQPVVGGKQSKYRVLYMTTGAIAASFILVVAAYFLYFHPGKNIQQVADTYIGEHLTGINQTMGSTDSMQLAISLYNDHEYGKALPLFENEYKKDTSNTYAKQYTGQVFLLTKDYDKALIQFSELANKKGLYSNPGLFLQAITLLKRNKSGDEEDAKKLLKEVIEQKLEGNKEAATWIQ